MLLDGTVLNCVVCVDKNVSTPCMLQHIESKAYVVHDLTTYMHIYVSMLFGKSNKLNELKGKKAASQCKHMLCITCSTLTVSAMTHL